MLWPGQVDWSAIVPLAVAVGVGGLGVAWRLGGLERTVGDSNGRLEKLERRLEAVEDKVDDLGRNGGVNK